MISNSLQLEIRQLTEAAVKEFRSKSISTTKVKGNGEFEVVATSENEDRDGEVILASAWDFKNYIKNPVVLWGHDWRSIPVGAVTSIEQVDGKVIVKGVFADTEAGQEIRKLYDSGILRTVSVGFLTKERRGQVITKAELVELSFIPIPSNTDAMKVEHSKALKKIEKMVKEDEATQGEEQTKTVIEDADKANGTDSTAGEHTPAETEESQAKAVGMKVGRVLSAKNIATIQGGIAEIATLKNGLDKVSSLLQAIIDSVDSEKALKQEEEKAANDKKLVGKIRTVDQLVGDILRELKRNI